MGRLLYISHSTKTQDMLFDIPFLADWSNIGEYRQKQTDKNTVKEYSDNIDWDY